MIIKHEISGYWNGDPVVDTEERIPKVGDMVVVHPHFICNGLDDNEVYTISSVRYSNIYAGYYVTLSGHIGEFPVDSLLLATRVDSDAHIAYIVPTIKSRCCNINVGDKVYTKVGYHIRGLADRRVYKVIDKDGEFVRLEGMSLSYPIWGLLKLEEITKSTERNYVEKQINKTILNNHYGLSSNPDLIRDTTSADFDGGVYIQKPTLLTPTQRTNSIISSIETSRKYGYSEKEKKVVAKLTTTVVLKDGTKGSATCDAGEYDERTGVLNAIANAKCGGNFDSEYNKYCKNREKIIKIKCKCDCCGKQYWTREDAHECRKKHIENKIRKHENYLIRREAKRRLAEEVKETAIKTAMEKIRKEEK